MKQDRIARILAARKGVKTRRQNQAQMDYIRTVVRPDKRRLQSLLTVILRNSKTMIRLTWVGPYKLKNGVRHGTLVGFVNGYYLRVLPEGYKNPQMWCPRFWELAN